MNNKKWIVFGFACFGALSLTTTMALGAENGPMISGLKMLSSQASLMAPGEPAGNAIGFTHDSPVPVNVFMKLPEGEWQQICYSDPSFEGHNLQISIPEGVDHAWFQVASDYRELIDAVADANNLLPEELPSPNTQEFDEQLASAGFEYVSFYGGEVLIQMEDYDVLPGGGLLDAETGNNHASATPDASTLKLIWYGETDGKVYCWGFGTNATLKGSTFTGTGGAGYEVVAYADYDGNGVKDLVWYHSGNGSVYVWFFDADGYCNLGAGERTVGNPDGGYVLTGQGATGYSVVATGDYNGDSITDLVWYSAVTGQAYVWFMNTDGVGKRSTVEGTGWVLTGLGATGYSVVATGDYNGDSVTDLVWYSAASGQAYVWFMNTDGNGKRSTVEGTGWVLTGQGAAGYSVVATGDYNGDGVTDLVWYSAASGQAYVWFMNTDGNGKRSTVEGVGWVLTGLGAAGYSVVTTGDYNGDSIIDLVWYSVAAGDAYVWFMNTDGNGKRSTVEGTGWAFTGTGLGGCVVVAAGDCNQNGVKDLVWYSALDGKVYVWFMNTDGNGKRSSVEGVGWAYTGQGVVGYTVAAYDE